MHYVDLKPETSVFIGLVHPKMTIVINYLPRHDKSISFIFETQIKIFFMKPESFELHWKFNIFHASKKDIVNAIKRFNLSLMKRHKD